MRSHRCGAGTSPVLGTQELMASLSTQGWKREKQSVLKRSKAREQGLMSKCRSEFQLQKGVCGGRRFSSALSLCLGPADRVITTHDSEDQPPSVHRFKCQSLVSPGNAHTGTPEENALAPSPSQDQTS